MLSVSGSAGVISSPPPLTNRLNAQEISLTHIAIEAAEEEWRPVVGYEGRYEASSAGRIRSTRTGEIKAQSNNKDGYPRVTLRNSGARSFPVHRLVAAAFFGEDRRQVDHINAVRTDNRLSNLRYCTAAENTKFRDEAGRGARGETSPHTWLTNAQIIEMRKIYARGGISYRLLGKQFGLSKSSTNHIITNRTWKHVIPPDGDMQQSREQPGHHRRGERSIPP